MAQNGTITVFVGDTTKELSWQARNHDASATLITNENFSDLKPGTYYTSIGDLENLAQFEKIIQQAATLIYSPPEHWSNIEIRNWTEDYLRQAATDLNKTVQGLELDDDSDLDQMLRLADQRKSDRSQIWVAGCSISHGIGVDVDERYGSLISKKLDLPVSFLTHGGASVAWAADQILRSDIRKNDLIFWGITSTARLTYWDDIENKLVHGVRGRFNKDKFLKTIIQENFFVSGTINYQSLISVHQTVKHCEIIGAKLILGTVLPGLESYLKGFKFFTPLNGLFGRNGDDYFIDLGSDNEHPGPLMHKHYADKFLEKYFDFYGK